MNATSTFRITTPGPFLLLLVHSHLRTLESIPSWDPLSVLKIWLQNISKTQQDPAFQKSDMVSIYIPNQICSSSLHPWLAWNQMVDEGTLLFKIHIHLHCYTVISHSYPQRGILSHIFPLPSSAWLVKLDAFWPTSVNMLSPCWPTGRNVMMTTMQWCNGCDHIKTSVF